MKNSLTCLAAIVLLASCTSSDDVPATPETPKESWYLYGWQERDLDDMTGPGNLSKIIYNTDSTVDKVVHYDGPAETDFMGAIDDAAYSDGRIVKYDTYLGNVSPYSTVEYEHKEGRLMRAKHFASFPGPALALERIDSFFYNNAGKLTSHIEHKLPKDAAPVRTLTEFTWTGENVTSAKSYRDAKLVYNYTFEYTAQENFYAKYLKADYMLLSGSQPIQDVHYQSRNLCSKRINFVGDLKMTDTMYFQYSFAENGFPQTLEQKYISKNANDGSYWARHKTFGFRKHLPQ
ncbi:hypothetical protein ACQKLP_07020 [Chitinophaga sp. NPDC101104]|uniref:hypothetical protein n=1 Tax=Chitinophaga sp. NPDC101104 TaxID=3390561 RepID=UPI003D079010